MGLALVFGVIGYIARKTGYEVTAILIGVLMGPLFEQYFLRALRVGQGDLDDPVLLDARQRAVGDGGRGAGAAVAAQPPPAGRAGADPARRTRIAGYAAVCRLLSRRGTAPSG